MRILYLYKSLILKGLNESECSTEAAAILLESCE